MFASHEASNRVVNSGLARWQLRLALEFLEAHLAEDIGLDELAHLVGISQSQFARAFKVSTGLPPYQWCLRNRVKRAQEMLLNGSDSLADTAIQNGFADQSHFTKTFRRVTGATPVNWKRVHRSYGR
jgi:transcriptional regulator GlxA family with amidase domain